MQSAAMIAAITIGVIALFQVALAFGAPAGAAAFGGQNRGVLPTRLRVVSGVAGFFLYPAIIVFVLDAGGVVENGFSDWTGSKILMWVISALFLLGAIANGASRSRIERIWSPVSLTAAICTGLLALWM
jgi:hypothetical protein